MIKLIHSGDKPFIKTNGYPSTLLKTCDHCGDCYDPMWSIECPGPKVDPIEELSKKVGTLENRLRQLESGLATIKPLRSAGMLVVKIEDEVIGIAWDWTNAIKIAQSYTGIGTPTISTDINIGL